MGKKCIVLTLVLALAISCAACGGSSAGVSVQRADQLAAAGQAGERYAGMVVSENVENITKDSTKRVEEVYVQEGQEVKAGDKLFTYDSDALELELEKAQLETEKMNGEQETYEDQLKDLEKQLKKAKGSSAITRLTLEINTLKTTMMENEYNLKAKAAEIENLQQMLANVDILSPVDGTIRSIDEQGETYISIQQSGAYRVKGMINEMSMSTGALYAGSRVQIYSRVSDDVWTGTVTSIDTEDASQNNMDAWGNMVMMDTMTTSSSYVFYVELDSVEGLLLGQHVYMEVAMDAPAMPGLWIPESFLADMVMDETTFQYTATVWADKGGKLEQRTVSLGGFDGMTGCWEILSGITGEDYLADPMNPACAPGAATQRREPGDFSGVQ